jgi:hypothetical protein
MFIASGPILLPAEFCPLIGGKSLHNFCSRHFSGLWQQILMINIFNCVLMDITGKVSSIGKGGTRLHKAHLPEFYLSVHTEPGKVDLNATVVARAVCFAV